MMEDEPMTLLEALVTAAAWVFQACAIAAPALFSLL
tara:strand:+ start:4034 stop:4141 length:108 start_codon:yes stop_codon:yes gene_type:complete